MTTYDEKDECFLNIPAQTSQWCSSWPAKETYDSGTWRRRPQGSYTARCAAWPAHERWNTGRPEKQPQTQPSTVFSHSSPNWETLLFLALRAALDTVYFLKFISKIYSVNITLHFVEIQSLFERLHITQNTHLWLNQFYLQLHTNDAIISTLYEPSTCLHILYLNAYNLHLNDVFSTSCLFVPHLCFPH